MMITSKILGTLADMDLEHLIIQITVIYVWWGREIEMIMDERPNQLCSVYVS